MDDIGLLLSAKLDDSSNVINKLNKQIETIEKKLNKINLKINIDNDILNKLSNTTKQFDNIGQSINKDNQVLKTVINTIKLMDGTIKKTTQQILQSGEILESKIKNENQQIEKQLTLYKNVSNLQNIQFKRTTETGNLRYRQLDGEIAKVRKLYDENSKLYRLISTYTNSNGQTVQVTRNAKGKVLNTEEITNYAKAQQQLDQIEESVHGNERRRLKVKLSDAEKQAKYSNKAKDDEYKAKKKLEEEERKADEKASEQAKKILADEEKAKQKAEADDIARQNREEQRILKLQRKYEDIYSKDRITKQEKEQKAVDYENNRVQKMGNEVNIGANKLNMNADVNELQNYAKTVAGLDAQITRITPKQDKMGNKIKEVSVRTKEGSNYWRNYTMTLDETTGKLYSVDKGLSDVTNRQMGFLGQLGVAAQRIPVWFAAMTAYVQAIRFIGTGVTYLSDLDNAMNEIRIVTSMSNDEAIKLSNTYNQLAQQMSVTTTEIATAGVEFARQGLAQEQVNERLQATIKYAKISGMEFQETAEIITASMNSMGVGAEKAIDVFSYLGDATATSSSDIGRAMQKVGGTAGSVRVPFEKVASYIATISATTRESAENIGNSLKSIFSRMASLKETGYDEEDGTQINQVAKALAEANVMLVDSKGQFRDFGTVLDELGNKWDTLDNRTQNYLSTAIAGTYQANRFRVLMAHYGESVDLYNQSLESAGTATNKFNIYQESMQAHTDKTKASLQGLYQSITDAGTFKALLDALTAVINGMTKLNKSGLLLSSVIGVISFAFLSLTKTFRTDFIVNVDKGNVQAGRFITNLRTMKVEMSLAAIGAKTLGLALNTILPALALSAAIYGIQKLIEKINEGKEAVKTLSNSIKEMDKMEAENKEISGLVTEYQALNSKIITTKDEKQKLYDIQSKLANVSPELVKGYDAEGNAILGSNKELQNYIDNLNQALEAKKQLVTQDFYSEKKDTVEKTYQKELDVLNKLTEKKQQYEKDVVKYSKKQIEASNWGDIQGAATYEATVRDIGLSIEKTSKKIIDQKQKVFDSGEAWKQQAIIVLNNDKAFNKLSYSIKYGIIDAIAPLSNRKNIISSLMGDASTLAQLQQFEDVFKNNKSTVEDLSQAYETTENTIRGFLNSQNIVGKQQNEITESILKTVNSAQYIKVAFYEMGQSMSSALELVAFTSKWLNTAIGQDIASRLLMYKKEILGIKNVAEAERLRLRIHNEVQATIAQDSGIVGGARRAITDPIDEWFSGFEQLLAPVPSSVSPKPIGGDNKTKNPKAEQELRDVKDYENAIEKLDQQLEESKNIREQLIKTSAEYQQQLLKENSIIEQKQVMAKAEKEKLLVDLKNKDAQIDKLVGADWNKLSLEQQEKKIKSLYNPKDNTKQKNLNNALKDYDTIQKKINDVTKAQADWNKETNSNNLEIITNSIEALSKAIDPINKQLDILDYKTELLSDGTFLEKIGVNVEKIGLGKTKIQSLLTQMQKLKALASSTTNPTALVAIGEAMQEVSIQIRDTYKNTIEWQRQIADYEFQDITTKYEHVMSYLEAKLNRIEGNLSKLKSGVILDDVDLDINAFVPYSSPKKSNNKDAVGEVEKNQNFINELLNGKYDERLNLMDTLYTDEYNLSVTHEKTMLGNIDNYLESMEGKYGTGMDGVIRTMRDKIAIMNKETSKLVTIAQMAANSVAWFGASKSERKKLESENQRLGASIGATSKNGKWYLNGTPLYSSGTYAHPGGKAIVGEEGREIIILPSGKQMLVGQKGTELLDLPKGTKVIPNKETENKLNGVPKYAKGTGWESMTNQGQVNAAAAASHIVINKKTNTDKNNDNKSVNIDTYNDNSEENNTYNIDVAVEETPLQRQQREYNERTNNLLKVMPSAQAQQEYENWQTSYPTKVSNIQNSNKTNDEKLADLDGLRLEAAKIQTNLANDILKTQVEATSTFISELKTQREAAITSNNTELANQITSQINEQVNVLQDLNNKIAENIGAAYEITFDILDNKVEQINKKQDDIQENINNENIKLDGETDSDTLIAGNKNILSSFNELLVKEKEKNQLIKDNISYLEKERDLYKIGTAEWMKINEQVEAYNEDLEDSNSSILTMNNNIKKTKLELDKIEIDKINSKTDSLWENDDNIDFYIELATINGNIHEQLFRYNEKIINQEKLKATLLAANNELLAKRNQYEIGSEEWNQFDEQIKANNEQIEEILLAIARANESMNNIYEQMAADAAEALKKYVEGLLKQLEAKADVFREKDDDIDFEIDKADYAENYSAKIPLYNEKIANKNALKQTLIANNAQLQQQNNSYAVGTEEWELINNKIKENKEEIEDIDLGILQINEDIEQTVVQIGKLKIDKFNEELSDIETLIDGIQSKIDMLDLSKPMDYSAKNSLQTEVLDLNKTELATVQSNITTFTQNRDKAVGKDEWKLWNDALEGAYAKEQQLIMQNAKLRKEQLQTQFAQQNAKLEKVLFNGESKEDVKKRLDDKKKDLEENISGQEKLYEIEGLRNRLRASGITAFDAELEALTNAKKINQDDLETIKKRIAIKELENKITNLQNNKNIQQLKQMQDGTWQFEYVADEEAINAAKQELSTNQAELEKQIALDALEKEEEVFNNKVAVLEEFQTLQQKALNGQYTSQEQFNKDIEALNKKLNSDYSSTWGEIVKSQTGASSDLGSIYTGMETSFGTYVSDMSTYSTQLTTSITNMTDSITKSLKSLEEALARVVPTTSTVSTTPTTLPGAGTGGTVVPGGNGSGDITMYPYIPTMDTNPPVDDNKEDDKDDDKVVPPPSGQTVIPVFTKIRIGDTLFNASDFNDSEWAAKNSALVNQKITENGGKIFGVDADGNEYDLFTNKLIKKVGYELGGETQKTGWHWLDGKPGKPERVLSPEQTELFNKFVKEIPNNNIVKKYQLNEAINKVKVNAKETSNVYHINANFPNATSSDEIRQAILGLPQVTTQYSRK